MAVSSERSLPDEFTVNVKKTDYGWVATIPAFPVKDGIEILGTGPTAEVALTHLALALKAHHG